MDFIKEEKILRKSFFFLCLLFKVAGQIFLSNNKYLKSLMKLRGNPSSQKMVFHAAFLFTLNDSIKFLYLRFENNAWISGNFSSKKQTHKPSVNLIRAIQSPSFNIEHVQQLLFFF